MVLTAIATTRTTASAIHENDAPATNRVEVDIHDSRTLRRIVDSHLRDGGHERYRQALRLQRGVYYNPLHFFSRAEATYTQESDVMRRRRRRGVGVMRTTSDLQLLRHMGLHVPGVDDMKTLPLRQSVDSDMGGTCDNDLKPTIVGGSKSEFEIKFSADAPEEVRQVTTDVARQWSKYFESDVKIRVCFLWREMEEGTLGATSTVSFVDGSEYASLRDGILYTPALASALEGTDLIEEDQYHVRMDLNLNINWHYSRTSLAAQDRFDLATTVLHELTHGLFFTGSLNVNENHATAEFRNGYASRFDQFMQAEGNISLVASCNTEEYQTDMYNAIRSPNLRFVDEGIIDIGLYAPRVYAMGSSIYHFNNETIESDCKKANIATSDCSDLMTHELKQGYTNRQLGSTTLRVYDAIRSSSAGVAAEAQCDIPNYVSNGSIIPNDANSNKAFTLPPWGIATVAAIGAVGAVIVVGAVVSTIFARAVH